jgi:hypothetical protein
MKRLFNPKALILVLTLALIAIVGNAKEPVAVVDDPPYDFYVNRDDGMICGCIIIATGQTLCDCWYPW